MEVSAILLARVIAFVESQELNPTGKIFFPDIATKLVERFNFKSFPSKKEDFDVGEGIKFSDGYFAGNTIDKLTIWRDGITLDVRSSSLEGKQILESSLIWLRDELGLDYKPGKITRWAYLSNLLFHSDANFLMLNPILQAACNKMSEMLAVAGRTGLVYEPTSLAMDFDKHFTKSTIASFKIERRSSTPFSENKYFSEAPLQTHQHIEILKELENGLLLTLK